MRSYPILKTKYDSLPVTVDQAKNWLRLDIPGYTIEDSKIEGLIAAAVDYVETECNLSLGVSDYEWYVDFLPCEIRDRYLIKSITSIEEEADSEYTLIPAENYTLIPAGELRSKIRWNRGFTTSSCSFRVMFKAGYDTESIPPRLLQAVRGLIAEWYDDPGDYVRAKKTMVDRLLEPYILPYAG